MHNLNLSHLNLWLPNADSPTPGWLRIAQGRIQQMGLGALPPELDGPVINKQGAHVLPGLVDAHRHFYFATMMTQMRSGQHWQSATEALEALREAVRESENPQAWIVFTGVDHSHWRNPRPIPLKRLDDAGQGRKVLLIDVTLHRAMVSSAALQRSGVLLQAQALGEDIDFRRDVPTGMVWEAAFGRVLNCMFEDLERSMDNTAILEMLKQESQRTLAQGLVAIHDPGLGASAQGRMAMLQDQTALRLCWSSTSNNGLLELPTQQEAHQYVAPRWGVPSVKIFLDGANRCAACLPIGAVLRTTLKTGLQSLMELNSGPLRRLLEPRLTFYDGHAHMPYLRFKNIESIVQSCQAFVEAGFGLKIHALGNEAALQAATIIQRCQPPLAAIEHVIALYPQEIGSLAETGAYIGMQTGFIPYYAHALEEQGLTDVMRVFPTQSLLRHGGKLVISSDAPCGPDDPLHNLRRATDRLKPDGRPLMQGEAISRGQAITASSATAAQSIGIDYRGLVLGEEANLTLCDGNPFDESTKVLETWIAGECVWRAGTP